MTIDEAMIMAAGLGTRMRPLTDTRPKPLIEVAGFPMIDHVLAHLVDAGVAHAVVNVHYLPHMLTDHLAERSDGPRISISDESELLLETGGGLRKAARLIESSPFFCINSDNLWTEDEAGGPPALRRMADAWDEEAMDALLLLVPRERARNHVGKGDFFLRGDGRVARRGAAESAPFIFTGVQLVSKRLLRDSPTGPFSTNLLWDRAIEEGRLFGLEHRGHWLDVGTVAALAPTEAFLAERSDG